MRLIDRREPIKTVLMAIVLPLLIAELFLIVGGRWVLLGSSEYETSDEVIGKFYQRDATAHWRVLNCRYWTGRSIQEVSFGSENATAPRECPFLFRAF